MDGSQRAERSVRVTLHCQRVTVELPDGKRATLSYPGVLLAAYEDGEKVHEKWVPLGAESSQADDERLIEALHEAFLWQNGEHPW
ncbi:MAG TPA: hypothetical protein VJT49_00550 [Amycolatopsis sp.]|uniref:hypothetical protein n=1 Tax=Amycolatopsis sp. TaxID=37632 RepID=UPI002B4A7D6F|nr:hypothetical protein [Amycolatopsis sp.]HKS43604.1 hypothetical protein [Amycolatopsis sp.]